MPHDISDSCGTKTMWSTRIIHVFKDLWHIQSSHWKSRFGHWSITASLLFQWKELRYTSICTFTSVFVLYLSILTTLNLHWGLQFQANTTDSFQPLPFHASITFPAGSNLTPSVLPSLHLTWVSVLTWCHSLPFPSPSAPAGPDHGLDLLALVPSLFKPAYAFLMKAGRKRGRKDYLLKKGRNGKRNGGRSWLTIAWCVNMLSFQLQ